MTQLERIKSIRCTFMKPDGVQCRRYAIAGGTVCTAHGGNLPAVKAKAAERIDEAKRAVLDLVPRAVERLGELMESPSDNVALKAASEVLDRAGYVVVRRTEELKVKTGAEVDRVLADLLRSRLQDGGVVLGVGEGTGPVDLDFGEDDDEAVDEAEIVQD